MTLFAISLTSFKDAILATGYKALRDIVIYDTRALDTYFNDLK